MKTILICPAVRPPVAQLSLIAPLAVVPILGECLLAFWLEHVAALGARHVIVIAADRAGHVRAAVGDGSRWGLLVEVVSVAAEPTVAEAAARRGLDETGWLPAPDTVTVMDHLPGCADRPLFESYLSWFVALQMWMPRALTPGRVRMTELRPGVWVGSGADISPRAELIAPCWIGDHVTIEAGTVIGPGTILEEHAVIGAGARVTESVIGPNTFVGRLTAVVQSLAAGNLLVNWQSGSALRVPDVFLLCSLNEMPSLVPVTGVGRLAAKLARSAYKPVRALGAFLFRPNRAATKFTG